MTNGDLYSLDTAGTVVSIENQLALKVDQSLITSSYVSKAFQSFNVTLNIGVNSIRFVICTASMQDFPNMK